MIDRLRAIADMTQLETPVRERRRAMYEEHSPL